MTITVEAVYANGVFRMEQPVQLPEGTHVRLTVHAEKETGDPLEAVEEETIDDPLEAVIGIGDGPPQRDGAQNHDKYISGKAHP